MPTTRMIRDHDKYGEFEEPITATDLAEATKNAIEQRKETSMNRLEEIRPYITVAVRAEEEFDVLNYVSVNVGPGTGIGPVNVMSKKLDDLNAMSKVLRYVRRESGLNMLGEPSDMAEVGRRTWKFGYPREHEKGRDRIINVCGFVKRDDEDGGLQCRVVEETVTKTEKRIVCPDDEEVTA